MMVWKWWGCCGGDDGVEVVGGGGRVEVVGRGGG